MKKKRFGFIGTLILARDPALLPVEDCCKLIVKAIHPETDEERSYLIQLTDISPPNPSTARLAEKAELNRKNAWIELEMRFEKYIESTGATLFDNEKTLEVYPKEEANWNKRRMRSCLISVKDVAEFAMQQHLLVLDKEGKVWEDDNEHNIPNRHQHDLIRNEKKMATDTAGIQLANNLAPANADDKPLHGRTAKTLYLIIEALLEEAKMPKEHYKAADAIMHTLANKLQTKQQLDQKTIAEHIKTARANPKIQS